MSGDEASQAWTSFLSKGRRRRWPWFIVDSVFAP